MREIIASTAILLQFFGGASMSQIQSLNQNLLDKYLASIGYQSVISNLPPERVVILDWTNAFAKVADESGVEWIRYKDRASIGSGAYEFDAFGGYHVLLRNSSKDYVSVDVYFMKSERHALDYMLKMVSLTNAPEIYAKFSKHPECFADFCMTGPANDERRARFVFGNVYVDVSSGKESHTESVIALAKTIHEKMRVAEKRPDASAPASPVLKLSLDTTAPRVGETVALTVDINNYPPEEWEIEIRVKGERLDYIDGNYGHEQYKAVSPGSETIKVVLMNKRTLQFAEVDKTVQIGP